MSVADKDTIEKFDFNLSQWESPRDLAVALHRVRDSALRGKVPLVFFDEFDSKLDVVGLGWLKYLLAPMQDGVFSDGNFTHQIGRAIFVFAGGTRHTFEEFRELAESQDADVKAPDFLSRLRGRVDVFGADPLRDAMIMRRAILLRSLLLRKFPSLFDSKKKMRINTSVLVAFLNVPKYLHGIRSIEALLEMSQLQGRDEFDPSLLPPFEQLQLHVDGQAFTRILRSPVLLGDVLDVLAKSIHKRYRDRELAKAKSELAKAKSEDERLKILSRRSSQEWDGLDQIYKDSNREQAADIPVKLAAIDCDCAPMGSEPSENFGFTEEEIERLARMEHERWIEERRLKQPNHPALEPWDKLSQDMKDKDIAAIEDLPEVLKDARLTIVRLK